MKNILKIFFLTSLGVFVSGCSLSLPQDIQTTSSQTISQLTKQGAERKNKVITMIGNAEVTALPIVEGLKKQVTTTIQSLIQGNSTTNNTVSCLKEQGVIYYTSQTCAFASQQKAFLEGEYESFDRIFCDPDRDLATCSSLSIAGTPARRNKAGITIYGVQTIDSLAKSFGCE